MRGRCHSVASNLLVEGRPFIVGRGRITIGEDVIFRGSVHLAVSTHLFEDSSISIGDRTHIGHQAYIRSAKRVTVGSDCLISRDVRIFDYNGHPLDPHMRLQHLPNPRDEVSPVNIGNNVWIGDAAFVNRGVRIGDNSIVSANSVVTKDVPPNTVVFGMPARVILWLDKLGKTSDNGSN